MPITCMRNFESNRVKGEPGKVLSSDEIAQIGDLMPQLHQEGLVSGKDDGEGDVKTPDADESEGAESGEEQLEGSEPQKPAKKGKRGR